LEGTTKSGAEGFAAPTKKLPKFVFEVGILGSSSLELLVGAAVGASSSLLSSKRDSTLSPPFGFTLCFGTVGLAEKVVGASVARVGSFFVSITSMSLRGLLFAFGKAEVTTVLEVNSKASVSSSSSQANRSAAFLVC
jgi:hypothetical protein